MLIMMRNAAAMPNRQSTRPPKRLVTLKIGPKNALTIIPNTMEMEERVPVVAASPMPSSPTSEERLTVRPWNTRLKKNTRKMHTQEASGMRSFLAETAPAAFSTACSFFAGALNSGSFMKSSTSTKATVTMRYARKTICQPVVARMPPICMNTMLPREPATWVKPM